MRFVLKYIMPGHTFEEGILPNIMFKTTPLLLLIVKKGKGLKGNSNNINLKISFKFRKY